MSNEPSLERLWDEIIELRAQLAKKQDRYRRVLLGEHEQRMSLNGAIIEVETGIARMIYNLGLSSARKERDAK